MTLLVTRVLQCIYLCDRWIYIQRATTNRPSKQSIVPFSRFAGSIVFATFAISPLVIVFAGVMFSTKKTYKSSFVLYYFDSTIECRYIIHTPIFHKIETSFQAVCTIICMHLSFSNDIIWTLPSTESKRRYCKQIRLLHSEVILWCSRSSADIIYHVHMLLWNLDSCRFVIQYSDSSQILWHNS